MSLMVMAYVLTFCRVVTGLVFLISGVSKVAHLPQFKQAIINFQILPRKLSGIAALLFLASEFGVVALIGAGGSFLLPGFLLAALLLTVFCGALASVLVRKLGTSCNCFGPSDKPVTGFDVLRNGGLIICALMGMGILFKTKQTGYSLSILEWILVGAGATVFLLIWMKLGDVIHLLSQEG